MPSTWLRDAFVGYGVYRSLTRTPRSLRSEGHRGGRRGYVGLNAVALCAAVELGLQPVLFHSANRDAALRALSLAQTSGDGARTSHGRRRFRIDPDGRHRRLLQRANLPLLRINHPGMSTPMRSFRRRAGGRAALGPIGIATLISSRRSTARARRRLREDAPIDLNLHKYGLHAIPTGSSTTTASGRTRCSATTLLVGRHAYLGYVLSAVRRGYRRRGRDLLLVGSARLVARRDRAQAGQA